MAGNDSIQFLRGTEAQRATHTETSLAGQPIYCTDSNRLYVGDGQESIANTLPIMGRVSKAIRTIDTLPHVSNVTFEAVSFSGLGSVLGEYVWSDGKNTYYSLDTEQFVLDKKNRAWLPITWGGYPYLNGDIVWSDGIDIFIMDSDPVGFQKLTSNGTFESVYDCTFNGRMVWSDGVNIYYDEGNSHYRWNRGTMRWVAYTPQGMTSFYGNNVWSDGINIRYTQGRDYNLILNRDTNAWVASDVKYPNNNVYIDGKNIFSDGETVWGYSSGDVTGFYRFDREQNSFVQDSVFDFPTTTIIPNPSRFWSDGENIYYSAGTIQLKLKRGISSVRPAKNVPTTQQRTQDDNIIHTTKTSCLFDAQPYTWDGDSSYGAYGEYVFTDGKDLYVCYQYELVYGAKFNQSTCKWEDVMMGGDISSSSPTFNSSDTFMYNQQVYMTSTTGNTAWKFDPETLNWSTVSLPTMVGKDVWYWNGSLYHMNTDVDSDIRILVYDQASDEFYSSSVVTNRGIEYGRYIWTDGKHIYYDHGSHHYILNEIASTTDSLVWDINTWNANNINIEGNNIFTDGKDIYCYQSYQTSGYKRMNIARLLDNNTWIMTEIELPADSSSLNNNFTGNDFWTDGKDLYVKWGSAFSYKVTIRASSSATPMFGYEYGTTALTSDVTVRSNVGNIGYRTPAANTTIANEAWTGTTSGSGIDIIGDVSIYGAYLEYDYMGVNGSFTDGDYYVSSIQLQRNVSGMWQPVVSYNAGASQVMDNSVDAVSHNFGSAYQSGDRYQIFAYVKRPTPSSSITFNAICTYKEIGVDGDGNTLADIRISGVPNITKSPTPSDALINTAALANVIGVNGVSFSQLNTRATVGSLNSNIYTANLCASNNCIGIHTMGTSRGVDSVTYSDSPVDITIYGAVIS